MPKTAVSLAPNKTAFIVLGMHRSGTSAMARALSLAGASLPQNLMPDAPDNPSGFWEPLQMVVLSDRLMAKIDSAWDDVFAGAPKPDLAKLEPDFFEEAVATIKANYGDAPQIVIKDPRLSVLNLFWREALAAAGFATRYIIMVRNPIEVAASLSARNGFSREKSLLLWSSYMTAAERDTRDAPRTFITYDALMNDWRGVLDKIEADLGVKLSRRTSTSSVEIDRFLRPELRHHADPRPLGENAQVWEPMRNLYSWFTAAAEGGATPNVSPEFVDQELETLRQVTGPIIAELQLEIRDKQARLHAAEHQHAVTRQALNASQQAAEQVAADRRRDAADAQSVLAAAHGESQSRLERIEVLEHSLSKVRGENATLIVQSNAQRDTIAKQEKTIAEQEDLLATQSQAAAEAAAEQEEAATEADAAAIERETTAAEREAAATEREHVAAQRESAAADREAAAALLESASAEREAAAILLESSATEREAAAALRESAAQEREADAREAQELVQEQARILQNALEAALTTESVLRDKLEQASVQRAQAEQALRTVEGREAGLQRQIASHVARDQETSRALADLAKSKHEGEVALADLRRRLDHKELLAEEMRLAASLEGRTLRKHLHEQTQALEALQARHQALAARNEAVEASTSWRLTAPLRRVLSGREGAARTIRNALKLVYWSATLQLPARLKARREFFAQNAAGAEPGAIAGATVGVEAPRRAEASTPAAPSPQAGAVATPPPQRFKFGWRVANDPSLPKEILGLYERRPDDAVPREAARGARFMERFGLLSSQPRFHEAITYLNAKATTALPPTSSERPTVSVIIPIYGQLAYTLNCLDSLLDHASKTSFEVIIGDDVSPDDSGVLLPLISSVKTIRHAENGGFILNCNRSAEAARGDYILLLNNDTRVVDGWLDELVDSFAAFPKAGLVGSKLFYPDGVLQEAGGIIWRDGSAWNYGREQDPNQPEFCYARQVDYISAASVILPRALWNELGGFDEHYRPAYCEDADLALRIASAGHEVWMQPLSRTIHYEGRTSGTDLTKGVKAYQVINMKKLFERWSSALTSHRPNAQQPLLEKDRNVAKRVLLIDSTTPTPDQDAGSVVTEATIKIYQSLGYKVTLIPRDNFLYDPKYTQALQRMGVECIYAPFEVDFGKFMEKQGASYDLVQIFRISVAEKCLADIRRHAPRTPVIFHNVDLHYLRMERQAEVTGDAQLRIDAAEMKVRELTLLRQVDATIVTSPIEQEILQREVPDAHITVFPYMVDVAGTEVGHAQRRDIMFLGGYRHTPNIDAAEWFAKELWPKLAPHVPEANLLLVGAHPPESVKALASDRIQVTGMVQDLPPYFDRTRVFVAPIRYGAGIKGKVATSMAHGLPVVATSCAAEGMYMEDERDILIADEPDAFIQKVLRIYQNPDEWDRLSKAGQDFVAEHNALPKGRRTVLSVIEAAIIKHGERVL